MADFGQNRLWPNRLRLVFVCVCVCLCVLCVVCLCVCGGFKVLVWSCSRDRPSRPSRDRPPPDRPKFRSFFALFRSRIHSFLPSLGVFSLNFGGVFEDLNVHVWALGLSCETPPDRAAGASHDSPRTPNVHI